MRWQAKETRKKGAQQNIKLSSVFVTVFLLLESHHEGSGHRQFAVAVQLAVLVLRSPPDSGAEQHSQSITARHAR
jgi:hypothetical protein